VVTGFNTNLRHAERVFHIQTEHSDRDGSVMETLVYADGEILARVTAAADAAADCSLRRALEKQHWDFVQQVRHGLLDDRTLEVTPPLQQRIDALRTALFAPVDLQQWRDACARRMALVFGR